MSIIKQNISKKTWIKILAIIAGILLIIGYTLWDILAGGPITGFFSNHDEVIRIVEQMGIFAPLCYIALQIAQIILAPVPGQIVNGIGGFLFGWWGIIWTVIGSAIGYLIVVLIAKKFGRPLLEKIFKKEAIDKFDFAIGDNASIILFLIFLLPGLPDDMVGYMAGLTDVPVKKLLVIILLGKLPVWIITNYLGMGIGESDLIPVAVVSAATVIILAIAFWQKDRIISALKKLGKSKTE